MDSKEKILTSSFEHAVILAKNTLYRDMPWRSANGGDFDAYKILVSEMMLQQTQVSRVTKKFNNFIAVYPTVNELAKAPLADVLRLWSGLGYNRRAKYLHDAAKQLKDAAQPWTYDSLVTCKGVGPNTAKAVLVYAYNRPELFIETNIRSVILYYFYKDSLVKVTDKQILHHMSVVIDINASRQWYWALMDLGAYLKQQNSIAVSKSHAYKKQSPFSGSVRQTRGAVIKLLGKSTGQSLTDIKRSIKDPRLKVVLDSLQAEGLITFTAKTYYLGTGL